jgi:hypothetical protein
MFDEESLHTLIARVSEQRCISLPKVLRASLLAVADQQFSVRADATGLAWLHKGGRKPGDTLRGLAAIAYAQRDWGSWHKPPWSNLKLLFVKEAVYLSWLDAQIGAAEPLQTEPAVDDGIATAPSLRPPGVEFTNVTVAGPGVRWGLNTIPRKTGLVLSISFVMTICPHTAAPALPALLEAFWLYDKSWMVPMNPGTVEGPLMPGQARKSCVVAVCPGAPRGPVWALTVPLEASATPPISDAIIHGDAPTTKSGRSSWFHTITSLASDVVGIFTERPMVSN